MYRCAYLHPPQNLSLAIDVYLSIGHSVEVKGLIILVGVTNQLFGEEVRVLHHQTI